MQVPYVLTSVLADPTTLFQLKSALLAPLGIRQGYKRGCVAWESVRSSGSHAWKTAYAVDRAQAFNLTNLYEALDTENGLLLQINCDARCCHRTGHQSNRLRTIHLDQNTHLVDHQL